MKITFILPGLHLSGGTISTIELANHLSKRGHEVVIIYPVFLVYPRLKWYNIKSISKNLITSYRSGKLLAKRILPAVPIIRVPTLHEKYIPDGEAVVATWWETAYRVNSYGKGKGRKIYYVRGYEIWHGREDLVRKTYHFPLQIVVTSSYLKRVLEEKEGVAPQAIIPNGVNFNQFYRINGFKREGDTLRVGMMFSRLNLKGLEDGLSAFHLASQVIRSIQLVLFGEKPDVPLPEGTEVHVFPPIDKLREIYNSLDVFLLSGREGEGFANPPLEAMACGTACVLTNVGGVPDYTIPGQTALVLEPGEVEGLASKLVDLLQNKERRLKMAEAGLKHVKKFTWDETARRFEEFLKAK